MRSSTSFWWLAAILAGGLAVAAAPAVAQSDDDDEEPQSRKLQPIQGTVIQTERAAPALTPEDNQPAEQHGTLPLPVPKPAGVQLDAGGVIGRGGPSSSTGTDEKARTTEPTASSPEQRGGLPLPVPKAAGDKAEKTQGTRVGR